MLRNKEQRLIERFRDRVRGGTSGGLRITLRVAGGHPAKRLAHQLVLDRDGTVSLDVNDAITQAVAARREKLTPATVGELWGAIEGRVDRFAPRRHAAFVPDSLVGYATIEVDGETVELVFAPDTRLLPRARETVAGPLGDLALRTILAAQRAPVEEDED
jgi:hypothetical protein